VTAVKFVSKVRKDSVASVENRARLDHRDCKACRELSEKSDFLDSQSVDMSFYDFSIFNKNIFDITTMF